MERYMETQKNLWYKDFSLQTSLHTTGRLRLFIRLLLPLFLLLFSSVSCLYFPPFAAARYSHLALILHRSFTPPPPPCWFLSLSTPDPLPPLPSFSSSSNLPPCLSFSSSTTASRATDSPLCLSVFFLPHHLARVASPYCKRQRQLTVVQVTGRKRRAADAVEVEAGFNQVASLAQIRGKK